MDVQLERRAGSDRRQSLFLMLDRRKSTGGSHARRSNREAGNLAHLGDNEPARNRAMAGHYWAKGEEVPPIE